MSSWLTCVPKAAASRVAGRFAASTWSRGMIAPFARHYGVDLTEAEHPLGSYPSLQAFFTRGLKPGARPVAGGAGIAASPADGRIGGCGEVRGGELIQAKGSTYSAAALLGDAAAAARFAGGSYVTIYLAPPDYHRVHAPEAGWARRACWIPGERWPVNAAAVRRVRDLFAVNERLVTYIDTDAGEYALVMVGACLVGGMRVEYDPGWRGQAGERSYEPGFRLERGQLLGWFEFGSTVVLLLPAGGRLSVTEGDRVRVGEPVWALGL